MNKKLLIRIKELFIEKLQAKTGWGRNEIISIYEQTVTEAIIDTVTTPEQKARDLLERMEIPNAQDYTAGELVELANLFAE